MLLMVVVVNAHAIFVFLSSHLQPRSCSKVITGSLIHPFPLVVKGISTLVILLFPLLLHRQSQTQFFMLFLY